MKLTRQQIIDQLKLKGIKTKVVGVSNDDLIKVLNGEKKIENTQNKAVKTFQNKSLDKKSDNFTVVKFLKPCTPYRKGDVVCLENGRYNSILKKDKSILIKI